MSHPLPRLAPRLRLRFAALLALFSVGVLAQMAALPTLEGSDESVHYTYVEHLRQTWTLPDRASFRSNATRQESGQPPLTYAVAALYADLLRLPSPDAQGVLDHLWTVRNRWLTPPNPDNRADNLNHYLHGRDERAFGSPEIVAASGSLRLLSLAYGLLAVVGVYNAARELFARQAGGERWALVAAALFAFTPTMIHISSYLTNDVSALAFTALATWQALVIVRRGASPGRALLVGAFLCLGGLSKVNTLLVAPAVGAALLVAAWQTHGVSARAAGYLVGRGALVALALLPLFGWVAWGLVTYGDPFGTMTHRNPYLSYDTLLPLSDVARLLPEIYGSYWAKFGLAKINLHPLTYAVFTPIVLLAIAGAVRHLRVRARRGVNRADNAGVVSAFLILALIIVCTFAGLVRWMQEIAIITGRLMYPAHPALALAVTAGLAALAAETRRRTALWLAAFPLVTLAAAGVVFAPIAIVQAYQPPRLLAAAELPALTGAPLDYDATIRLLGMSQATDRLPADPDAWHTVTLCWQVLAPTERRAAFSVKFVRDGVIVADRTSLHGLGHYDSSQWRAGDIWCDAVDVPLDDPDADDDPQPQPATVYDILVVLLDARTGDVNWTPTAPDGTPIPNPFIGQVISPAGQRASSDLPPVDARFGGFAALTGASLSLDEGVVRLAWRVPAPTPENWTQFVHLYSADGAFVGSLADGIPRAGAYPTWAWAAGETFDDAWAVTLPTDLPPGEYVVGVGFYRADTGERAALVVDGVPVADGAARVAPFSLP